MDGRNEWITARRKAEELLAEDPGSYARIMFLVRLFWQGEGRLCACYISSEKISEIYEKKKFKRHPDPPWRLESEGWWSLQIITGDKGDYEGELELIDTYNDKQAYYQMEFGSSYNLLLAERGWWLMKLHRYADANIRVKGIETDENGKKSLGYNVLCATAGEEGNREESLINCEAALNHASDLERELPLMLPMLVMQPLECLILRRRSGMPCYLQRQMMAQQSPPG